MRHLVAALVGSVVLGAAGFAAASAVHATKQPGGSSTATGTGVTGTGTTPSHKVLICHRTGSKKHPQHTISVDQHAAPAHLAHGDTLGACPTTTTTQATTQSTTAGTKATKGKSKAASKGKSNSKGSKGSKGKAGTK